MPCSRAPWQCTKNVPDKKKNKQKKDEPISSFQFQNLFFFFFGSFTLVFIPNLIHSHPDMEITAEVTGTIYSTLNINLVDFRILSIYSFVVFFFFQRSEEVRGLAAQTTPVTFRAWRVISNSCIQSYSDFFKRTFKRLTAVIIAFVHFDSKTVSQAEKYTHLNMSIPKYNWWQNIYKTGLFKGVF